MSACVPVQKATMEFRKLSLGEEGGEALGSSLGSGGVALALKGVCLKGCGVWGQFG